LGVPYKTFYPRVARCFQVPRSFSGFSCLTHLKKPLISSPQIFAPDLRGRLEDRHPTQFGLQALCLSQPSQLFVPCSPAFQAVVKGLKRRHRASLRSTRDMCLFFFVCRCENRLPYSKSGGVIPPTQVFPPLFLLSGRAVFFRFFLPPLHIQSPLRQGGIPGSVRLTFPNRLSLGPTLPPILQHDRLRAPHFYGV